MTGHFGAGDLPRARRHGLGQPIDVAIHALAARKYAISLVELILRRQADGGGDLAHTSRLSKKIMSAPPVAAARPSALETYDDNAIINEIRSDVDAWRDLPGGADWGVTPTT
jgi:hypothetical protein